MTVTAFLCVLACFLGLAVIVALWKRWGLIDTDNDKSASMVKGSPEARQPYWEAH